MEKKKRVKKKRDITEHPYVLTLIAPDGVHSEHGEFKSVNSARKYTSASIWAVNNYKYIIGKYCDTTKKVVGVEGGVCQTE